MTDKLTPGGRLNRAGFWGLRFVDGTVPDGQYARGWSRAEAHADARRRWGDKVDEQSLHRWEGVL